MWLGVKVRAVSAEYKANQKPAQVLELTETPVTTTRIIFMSVPISQPAGAQSDQSISLILRPQQLEIVLRDVFPFNRETLRLPPDIARICVSRAEWKLLAWRMTSYQLQSKGHQMVFSEIQRVSRLEVAMIYATLMQALFQGFPQVATHLNACALRSPGPDAGPG